MKSILTRIFIALLSLGAIPAVNAQFSATYDFASAITDTPTVTNVTFSSLSATNVTASRLSGGQASATAWVTNGASPDLNEYVSISFQANTSYELALTSMSFKSSRSSTGPASFSVALFIGGSLEETSSTFTSSSTSTTTSSMPTFTFNFSDVEGIVATDTVEFRFYGWGGTGGTGSLRFDDITFNGTVALASIPEPSAFALVGGLAVVGFVASRRRRSAA